MTRRASLRGRLVAWFGSLMAVSLLAMGLTAWLIASQEDEPPDSPVALAEGPDPAPGRELFAFAAGIPVALGVALAGGSWIARRTLRPLEELASTLAALDPKRLDARVPLPEGAAEEVAVVAASANAMLERLERQFETTRRFTADASHELRTPLATLRTELEVDLRRDRDPEHYRRTMGRALAEIERLTRLVESLLALARSDAGQLAVRREPVDLADVARDASARIAAATGRRIDVAASPSPAEGDPELLSRALSNLLENACKFSPPASGIHVRVSPAAGGAEIVVDDGGAGIPAGERERVFERFQRRAEHQGATPGAGLGLALAREIARAHGGTLTLEDAPGGGLRARLTLAEPRSRPRPNAPGA